MKAQSSTTTKSGVLDLEFFSLLSEEDQDRVFDSASIVTFDAGQQLLFRDEALPGLFVVMSGETYLQTRATSKKALTFSTLGRGAIYGFGGLVGRMTTSPSLFAKTNGSILVIPFDLVRGLMEKDHQFALMLFDRLEDESRSMRVLATELSLQDAQGRLAAWVLRQHTNDQSKFQLTRTQSEIASEIGTVREVVSRGLTRFERDEMIGVEGKCIQVRDIQRLNTLASFLPQQSPLL